MLLRLVLFLRSRYIRLVSPLRTLVLTTSHPRFRSRVTRFDLTSRYPPLAVAEVIVSMHERLVGLASFFFLAACTGDVGPTGPVGPTGEIRPATLTVGTCDSPGLAAFQGDCQADQVEINAALNALPASGGIVLLLPGTYDIQASDSIAGVLIGLSNVVLAGSGPSTRLLLADDQNVNVVAVFGDGLTNVTVRDLYINGNRSRNTGTAQDPWDADGVRAKNSVGGALLENIVVQNCVIEEAARLNVQLIGRNVRIVENFLGDAGRDVAEIAYGPGEISHNFVTIRGTNGFGLGTDAASNVRIESNTVTVKGTGQFTEAVFRFWIGQQHNLLANNTVVVESGGFVNDFVRLGGRSNIVTGNNFVGNTPGIEFWITGSASVVTGNIFHNTAIIVDDQSPEQDPTVFTDNLLINSTLTVLNGNVVTAGSEPVNDNGTLYGIN